MNTTLRQQAIEKKNDSDKRQNNKQHCTKIDQGLKKLDQNSSTRAIWELTQNARDLSEECNIKITLNDEYFIFTHNGAPFTPDSLSSLIKQVSSEEKENPDKVGQYGTGFLTTHSISKILRIDGSFQLDPEEPNYYVNMDDFEIDRTYTDINDLITKLTSQLDHVDELMMEETTSEPTQETRLKYLLSEGFHKVASKGISEAKELMPYVMVLNEKINSCSIDDEINDIHISYSKEQMPNCGDLKVTRVITSELNAEPVSRDFYYLQSEDGRNKIIMPLSSPTTAIPLDNVSKLFLYFPLLGSENFGVNYIFHSADFIPLEARDGIFLPNANLYTETESEQNKNLLYEMSDMLFKYLEENISTIENSKYLAAIKFENNSDDDESNDFFSELQEKWVSFFSELNIIDTAEGRMSVANSEYLNVFDDKLTELLVNSENPKYLDAIYDTICEKYDLPLKEDCLEWSKIINDWGLCNPPLITIENVMEDVSYNENLDTILDFIYENELTNLLNDYKLIPNRENELNKANDLVDASEITNELYLSTKEIIPNSTCWFIKDEEKYKRLYDFDKYTRTDLRNDLTQFVHETEDRLGDDSVIEPELKESLVKFCSNFPAPDGNTYRNRIMPIICELNGYDFTVGIIPSLSGDEVDIYARCFDFLVEDELISISQYSETEIAQAYENIRQLVEQIVGIEKYKKNFIPKYAIFLNQNKVQCLAEDLYTMDINIDNELAELYSRITGEDLKECCVDESFASLWEFKEKTAGEIGNDIEKILKEDKYSSSETIEIINKLENGKWKGLFPDIENNKVDIFYSRIPTENKKHIFKIMKIENLDNLANIAELAENPQCSEIINIALKQLQNESDKRIDFEHKHRIGKYIEEQIREKLDSALNERIEFRTPDKYNSPFAVDDIQNGQDMIVMFNGEPIEYIEVKAKWNFNEDAYMSKNQMRMAMKYKDQYSLCCVDLTEFNGSMKLPEASEVIKNSYIHLNIGSELTDTMDGIYSADNDQSESKIRIIGDYKAKISKTIFTKGTPFKTLIEKIINKIM